MVEARAALLTISGDRGRRVGGGSKRVPALKASAVGVIVFIVVPHGSASRTAVLEGMRRVVGNVKGQLAQAHRDHSTAKANSYLSAGQTRAGIDRGGLRQLSTGARGGGYGQDVFTKGSEMIFVGVFHAKTAEVKCVKGCVWLLPRSTVVVVVVVVVVVEGGPNTSLERCEAQPRACQEYDDASSTSPPEPSHPGLHKHQDHFTQHHLFIVHKVGT